MELPRLEPIYQKYKDQGLQVIAVDSHHDTERATRFIAKHKLSYPCLENGEGDADFAYGTFKISGHPSSFLIDEEGRILYFHFGYEDGDDAKLEKEIQKILSFAQ